MKKLILFSIISLSMIATMAQGPGKLKTLDYGNKNKTFKDRGSLAVDSALFLPVRPITATSNEFYRIGAITISPGDSGVYIQRSLVAAVPWNQFLLTLPLKTATIDFGSQAAQTSGDSTVTVTGAALGDPVIVGVPLAAAIANVCYTAFVSATNTVTIRLNNYSSSAKDPASGIFTILVQKK